MKVVDLKHFMEWLINEAEPVQLLDVKTREELARRYLAEHKAKLHKSLGIKPVEMP